MHSRMGMMAHTPSFAVTLAGHGVAWVIFLLTFPAPSVRPVWIPQFSLLLALATALLLAVPLLPKRTYRLAALLAAVLVDVVLGIPQGPDLALEAVLGTVFIFVVMTVVEGGLAYFLCVGCALALSWSHWPITALGISVAEAAPISSALLGAYFLFLVWLAGLVGSGRQRIRHQDEELARIDRTVQALSEANLDFQELATRVQRETENEERRRITREVHDIVGYTLTNIQMMMEAASDLVRRDMAGLEEILVKSRDQAQRGLLETRRAMRNFRAVSPAKSGGLGRVSEVVRIFEKATKVAVNLHLGNAPESFGTVIDDVVYRMVQESLTNALRHGNATAITVNFWVMDGALRLSITDNGAGSSEVVPGIGLSGMAERIANVGGSMRAENTPFGFVVSGEFPLPRPEGV